VGDGAVALVRLAPLHLAGPDGLSFLVSPAYIQDFQRSRAGAVLIAASLADTPGGPPVRIVVDQPDQALSAATACLHPPDPTPVGIDDSARIAPTAIIGAEARIAAFVSIGARARIGARVTIEPGAMIGDDVQLGDDCRIGPNAVCYAGARLGNRVTLKAGAVIGGAGFGYLRGNDGHRKMPHLGACILEDDVEIGSGSCVDRGSFEDTVIGRGTKIDNLVQVGHNVQVGARCLIMATTGIAGSCRIGSDVVIAGGVGVADHVTIGDRAVVGAKSVVFGPGQVPPDAAVSGYPARPHRAFLRAQAALYRLPALIDAMEAMVERDRGAPADGRPER
jgi:UDP-3-O-[3-hydroxymyristoyl] glucosamine N-acyltransferase